MKDFLLLANINAITYKEFFPLLKEGKVNTGYVFNKTLEFETPEGQTKKQTGICWYTTFPVIHKHLVLTKTYNPQDFQAYDNYNAINVDRVKDIPYDYEGVIGVPITIFQYDLDNVEIVGFSQGELFIECGGIGASKKFVDDYYKNGGSGQINEGWKHVVFYSDNGKPVTPYQRIFIRKKKLFKTTNPNRS